MSTALHRRQALCSPIRNAAPRVLETSKGVDRRAFALNPYCVLNCKRAPLNVSAPRSRSIATAPCAPAPNRARPHSKGPVSLIAKRR